MSKKTNIKNVLLNRNKRMLLVEPESNISPELYLDSIGCLIYNKGIKIIQLNGSKLTSSDFLSFAFKLRQITSIFNVLFFIEDRLDIAKIIDADGVFLSETSIDFNHAKIIIDEDKVFGTNFSNFYFNKTLEFDYILSDENLNSINLPSYKRISNEAELNNMDMQAIKYTDIIKEI